MQYLAYNEDKQRGTSEFPFEFYHIDQNHPQYNMSLHWHVEFEMIRILKGEFKITIDEEMFVAREGDTLFINSGVLHGGIPYACVYECIVFDLNAFIRHNPGCQKLIQQIMDHTIVPLTHYSSDQHKDIHDISWQLFRAMNQQYQGYELNVFGLFYCFFGTVYQNKYYIEDSPKTHRDYKKIRQLKKVLEQIENSYTTQISLDELAGTAGMSPKYFCRFFFQMTHKRPMDYLNYHRIEHACYRLATTDESVTEVAYNCGFNDLSYFIKTFRKYMGVTPGKYLK